MTKFLLHRNVMGDAKFRRRPLSAGPDIELAEPGILLMIGREASEGFPGTAPPA
jgi:hypothetical protein